ncbi:MAG: VCBS repeat-containing protein [Proteobacteria bacterium]|nr:VCBS repeat-containing protein [Pseudomonadota bacterium]MDA1226240.1 VCBS repeat-containing protein [Bacteroidota bacterium]MDA3009057.1 VCBS repeat-containing protein [Actinomycetota bacterium]
MKKLPIYISLLFVLTCAKEDSQAPNTPPTQIVKQYTLTATAGDGGSVTGGGTFASGTQVNLTATPSAGYSFSSWSNGSTANPLTVTLNSNTSVTANFELVINTYTLSIESSEGGSVTSPDVSGIISGGYAEGTQLNLIAEPNSCYRFLSWSDGEIENPRIVTLNQDLGISAVFENINNEIEYSLVKLKFPCAYPINPNKPYNETTKYKVGPSAWFSASVQESYDGYYYPTNQDYNPPGYYYIDPHNFAHGDFNNDGLEDLVITWATFSHTLERQSRYNYSIFLNNGDGSMSYDHEAFKSSSAHYNHFAYRTKVADFNNDGILDIISASMGVIQRLPGQNPYTRWERIPLMYGLGNGEFYDASTNIEGQEDGVSPPAGHSFGHELDIGDVDGDGDVDIYTGKILLLNDGNGFFQNATDELIDPLKPNRNIWSSVVADFNNDGIEDFFVPYAEPSPWNDYLSNSGFYSLSKDGKPSFNNSITVFVSEAKYGISNSKFNYAIDYDINLDGYKDIIIAVTRADPYYVGKGLQVFLNVEDTENGNRKFVSGDHLLPDENILDNFHGEGQLSVLDINNDGILDIAHTTGAFGDEYGLSFYINNGGSLQLLSLDNFAYLGQEQFPGREDWGNNNKLSRAIPINLDNTGWIDYISYVSLYSSDSGSEQVFYSVLAKD